MKKLLFLFCFSFFTSHYSFSQGVWTWMSGDTIPGSGAVYGTLGIPSVNNHPSAVYSAYCWTDLQGNFWLFGGENFPHVYGEVWKFNPTTLEWTWVQDGGSAIYGTKGVPKVGNTPGARNFSGCTWVDTSGLWLYGGNSGVDFADLWKYNIASNEWTWMSGSNQSNQLPVYGTQGVPSPLNYPGSRCEIGSSWVDANGKFWLYGGQSYQGGLFSDMWMYDPVTNMWTWESGAQGSDSIPVYGSKGNFSVNNTPGGREPYAMITENNGNFLFFGGSSVGGLCADMWEYNPAINLWAWINGAQTVKTSAVVGASCQSDSTFYPDARYENRAVWKDCAGNFWMYGGFADNDNDCYGDVWVYLVATKKWARMSASNYKDSKPVYGKLEIPSLSNLPGAKGGSAHWANKNGNFWIYGGLGKHGFYGDMWRYTPDSICTHSKCNCQTYAGTIIASPDSICLGSGLSSQLNEIDSLNNLQWQSSIDGINFSDLTGDTLSTYITPALSQATYYRVNIKDKCGIITSSVKKISVVTNPVTGIVTSNPNTVCSGSSVHLTVTGSSGTIQWQSSPDGISFADISSANSTTYPIPGISQTTFYRVKASNSCGMDSSIIVTVNVIPPAIAGTVTSSRDSICYGTGVTSQLSVSGNSGNIQWQSSTDGIHFIIIEGDTLNNYITPKTLSQTTYYRAMAMNSCGSDSSNAVIVHILPPPSVNFIYTINGKQVSFLADSVSSNVVSYHWDFGDGKTSNEINPIHTFDSIKTYYACLTVNNNANCSFTSCQYVSAPNGVQNISAVHFIRLYPNPANNELTIEVLIGNAAKQITISNDLGQTLIQLNTYKTKTQIDIHALAAGIYFVKTQLADGSVEVNKLVKE